MAGQNTIGAFAVKSGNEIKYVILDQPLFELLAQIRSAPDSDWERDLCLCLRAADFGSSVVHVEDECLEPLFAALDRHIAAAAPERPAP
ncbi:MAG: hypothetical protein PHP59_01065 [Methanofollis sp.]|uniref:hypothetical protein n=1 Tax=Methanofollis sp. TaxID=2052835 RepID=UPI002607335E|nr:hypothetical protein [Methanofollis sp.]MDD4253950.1 hypothetical protein [Methanofollis sp.]